MTFHVAGPFGSALSVLTSVAYSSVITMDIPTFIIPLRREHDIWAFVYPFSIEVWIFSLLSIPIYILVWGLLNYLNSRQANWTTLVGFVVRNSLVDHAMKMPDKTKHQKALILGWIWFTLVIVSSYAGNLIAQITRPKLVVPIREAGDLLTQDEISMVAEEGTGLIDFMRESPPGST